MRAFSPGSGSVSDMQDSVKSLSEKLSAALLTISAKEGLVKQHAKVAEDAVAGIFFFMLDCMHSC